MNEAGELFIGLMSGTSVDGIDAVIVGFESESKLSVIETLFTPFPDEIRSKINKAALNNSLLQQNKDSQLHFELSQYYSKASLEIIDKAGLQAGNISAIANHGQTVKHEPNANPPYSLQLGCGQLLANNTGIKVITQFRQADLANGGQGAPLMPAFHKAIFSQTDTCFILNLGGIANITQLNHRVVGFDTGPSNTLLDQWINKHQGHHFDNNGEWGASGNIIPEVLSRLLQDTYLHQPYPKSTGTDYFNLDWLNNSVTDLEQHNIEDIQATLLAFTVKSIALALEQLNANSGDIFVCGGGAKNLALMSSLQQSLAKFNVRLTDDLGIPCDWVEAIGFAWLGYCFEHNISSNLPSVTGASQAVVLGQQFIPEL